jgi:hypothetical protein
MWGRKRGRHPASSIRSSGALRAPALWGRSGAARLGIRNLATATKGEIFIDN